jgi:putative polymerase
MQPWYLLMMFLLMFAIVRAAVTGYMEVKYVRDVMIIPTFIVLGMTFDPRRLGALVVAIHTMVVAVALFEVGFPSLYSKLFLIQDYYVATRGFDTSQFWNADSDLFVSAERSGQRLFSFIDLHRLSSLFLEPVSFGNYCIVIFAYAFAVGPRIGRLAWWFLILGAVGGIIGSDGRLAAATSAAIVALSWLAPRLPRRSALLYLPVMTICTILVVHALALAPGTDDLAGRVANTVSLLGGYDLPDLLGLSDRYVTQTLDSGLGYLIVTQSIFGAAVIYVFIVGFAAEDTPVQRRFVHSVCVYLAFSMLVSYAFLTIKTASLLWFLYGALLLPTARARLRE